jgi:hypothetical protein
MTESDPLVELKKVITQSGVSGPNTSLESNVSLAVSVAITLAFGVSLVMFAVSMIQFITSRGDPKNFEKAMTAAFWSAAGLVLSISLIYLKNIILSAFGLNVGF